MVAENYILVPEVFAFPFLISVLFFLGFYISVLKLIYFMSQLSKFERRESIIEK
jgi:uncharacterized membrane protein YciS (DUF1049 family)